MLVYSSVRVHCLLCRHDRSLPNPVYECEYMGSGSGGVVQADMTKNPAYMTSKEVVTSFTSGTEEEKDKEDYAYEVLPYKANEEEQKETTLASGQGDAAVGGRGGTPDDVYAYVNQ